MNRKFIRKMHEKIFCTFSSIVIICANPGNLISLFKLLIFGRCQPHKIRHFFNDIPRRRISFSVDYFVHSGTVEITVLTKWINLYIFFVNKLAEHI